MNANNPGPDHATQSKQGSVAATQSTCATLLRAPRSIADTGLPALFVAHLLLKSILQNGKSSLGDLMVRHCLTAAVLEETIGFLVREHLVEIAHRGASDVDVHLRLTEAGRELAAHEASRSTYCGPAPVSLEAYVSVVNAYSVKSIHIAQSDVRAAFANFVADMSLLDCAVAALNAGRPVMLYGPAGSGKTYLAERLGGLLRGAVPIPYALYVAGDVIQIHDPLLHRDAAPGALAAVTDRRWRVCERPVVMSGGELTLALLDLQYNANSGFYQAPPHMKANMGLYVVDDLGRQRVAPSELLNRWITPLDRGVDQFALQSGARFVSPFDVWPVFSTNLTPAELNDNAFLRRLGSKIHVGALCADDYRRVFDTQCEALGIEIEEGAFEYLLNQLHQRSRTPFLACYPADLLGVLRSFALYHGDVPTVTEYRLTHAWHCYFGGAPEYDQAYPSQSGQSDKRYAGA
ncbi:ATP-binding protein [bacterium M00.F.Ca.ET.228.01.1.1]|nr:ATP-binding protein [bacterium M00.F.Ca.ET.228.01.1.1]TGR95484.1 ATP-binding protein [bacterium M00.F.Ca.ET.191.01.1.1]TGT96410.1 ATP-binding protein [bacterium M00.F.Ca.ET.155.01.1.1]